MPRYKILVCNRCGTEKRIPVHTREEAERKKVRLVPPQCPKCGSTDVKLHD